MTTSDPNTQVGDASVASAPSNDAPAAPPAEQSASEAAVDAGASPSPASDASASGGDEGAGDDGDADGGDAEGGDADDGEAAEGDAAEGGAAAEGAVEGGETKAKKRRRRRRKKKDAPVLLDAEGNPIPQPPVEPGAEGEGAEGEGGPAGEGGERKRKERPRREAPAFRVGEEVFGKVERVTDDAILVDIAGKAQGLFDRRELAEDQELPGEGEQFVSTVASIGIRGGMVRVSKAPLPLEAARTKVEEAFKAQTTVEGFITGAVRGGVEVDVDGLRAFAPASHVDLHPGGDLSHLVGRLFVFHILSYEKKGRDVVLSRRKFLEAEASKSREAALAGIEQGASYKAIVRAVKQWGVFVALPEHGMVEGLIPREEASHDRMARLEDSFRPGEEIEVRVTRIENRNGQKKLWLSRKAATDDPWEASAQKYAVGTRHTAKVARLQPFGVFVELEPGIDGLIHTADLSFKPIEHPKDVVKVDDMIDVVVATNDPSMHRIALHPAPPPDEANEPRQRVAPYKPVKVAVVSTNESGVVVRVIGSTGRHARGFIPGSHTGFPRGHDLRKEFPVGTKLEVKVIEVDTRRGEVKLSIRALKDDAEKAAYNQFREGVQRDAKFGTFADLMKKG